VQLVRGNIIKN